MIRMIYAACLLLPLLAAGKPPMPVESEWLVTESSSFLVMGNPTGRGSVGYEVKFQLRKPVTETLYVTVDFENPEDRESPLFAEFEVAPGATAIEAKSEQIRAIRNREKYLVKVWIYADAKRKQLLGTHEQLVEFKAPRALLDQLGIEVL